MIDCREIMVEQHGVSIQYQNFEKKENMDLVHDLILQSSFLFPRWLKNLTVCIYDQPPTEFPHLEARVYSENWEYGIAQMDLYAKFFDRPEDRQLNTIVHELIHITHGKLLTFDRKYLLGFIEGEDERLANILRTRHTEIMEEFVETMADVVQGIM